MKRRVIGGIGMILLVAGLAVILYPQLRQFVYQQKVHRMIGTFEEQNERTVVDGETTKENYERLYRMMEKYNQKLIDEGQEELKDPYAFEDTDIDLVEYGIDDGIVGYLRIPEMDIELPLYLGANDENMKKGAAQLTKTSMPIGGESTNTVIAAHRGYSYAAMFRNIDALEIGDEVFLTNLWETMTYKVVEIKIILPSDINKVLIQEGRDLITLITCHPYMHNYQRYVVYCERES